MTKEEILAAAGFPNTPEGIAAFYDTYGSREEWEQAQQQMAYGGAPFIQGFPFGAGITMAHGGTPYYGGPIRPYGEGGGEGDMSNIPMVKAVPKGYIKSTDKPGMYERTTTGPGSVVPGSVVPKIIPVQPQNRTKNPKQYENDLIELVKSGKKTVEDLVGSGAITQEFAKTLAPYSKKDYVRLEEPAAIPVKAGIPLKDEDRIDRKDISRETGSGLEPWATYSFKDVNAGASGATNKYVDRATGRYIDPMKSEMAKDPKDPTRSILTKPYYTFGETDPQGYLEPGTLKQTRLNTPVGSATDNPVVNAMSNGLKFGGNPNYDYFAQAGKVVAPTPEEWEAQQQKMQEAKTQVTKFPTFNTRGSYEKFKQSNVNFAQYSDADMEGLGVTVPPVFVPNPNQKPQMAYTPSGQAPGGAGLFNNKQGQQFVFQNGQYIPYDPNAALTPMVSKRFGGYRANGGAMTQDLQGQYPIFGKGGYDYGGSSAFGNAPFPAMEPGGDTTVQGANQKHNKLLSESFMTFIKNNVMRNMHQEESQKVQDTFMQMEQGQHQMRDGSMMDNSMMGMGGYTQQSFDMIDPQNAALQNMYSQQINQHQNQNALDKTNFRQANRNLFNTFSQHDLPEAKEGKSTVDQSALMHQFAEEFGPRSRRNGLPLFPANVSSNMQLTKKSAKALQGVPKGFKMDGFEMTPKYGLLARTRMGQYMGLGPKSINYKFSGTRGYLPGEPQPDEKKGQYGPAPKGTIMNPTESLMPYNPETNPGPGAYNFNAQLPKGPMGQPAFPMNKQVGPRSSEQFNQSYKTDPFEGVPQGYIPKQIYMQSQLQPHAYGGYVPTYQGDLWGSQTKDPNAIDLPQNNNAYSFNTGTPPANVAKQAGINTQTPVTMADQSKNSAYVQGPQVQYDATKDRSQERLDFAGKMKRKFEGVGEAIGQWGSAGINKLAGKLETDPAAKTQLAYGTTAEKTFKTSPLNAIDEGGYDFNSGVYQPDKYVTRYGGVSWGTPNVFAAGGDFEEGDEVDLSPEEIEDLRAQGYDVEYLD